jgi:hypothetical protein
MGSVAIVQTLRRPTAMQEHRRYHRVRPSGPAKAGSIFVDLKKPAIVCHVVDISAGGACLEVHGSEVIPTRFTLNHGGVKKSCRIIWQKGRRIGVSF